MAKKPSPEKPAPSSLLPGFQHLIPSAAAAPLAAHIRPLFLPDLVQQIARNKQIDANRREQAHPAFRKWAKDLKQGVLQQLHETQVEQDFNHVLLRGLGYTTQSDVASDQPWTLTPKWNVPGSGEVDAALGKFRLDESGWLSGEPLVMVELKGAKVELDRKMPTRNITPVQQVWNYLNASESAQWAIVCNYAEIRLYSRQKSSNPRAPRAADRAGRPGQVRRVLRDLPCRQPAGNRPVRPEYGLAAPGDVRSQRGHCYSRQTFGGFGKSSIPVPWAYSRGRSAIPRSARASAGG